MNISTDKAGNKTYTPRGYTESFFSKSAATHAEWLTAQLAHIKKPVFRVILPTRFWIECATKQEAQAIIAESGGQIMEFA